MESSGFSMLDYLMAHFRASGGPNLLLGGKVGTHVNMRHVVNLSKKIFFAIREQWFFISFPSLPSIYVAFVITVVLTHLTVWFMEERVALLALMLKYIMDAVFTRGHILYL